MNPRRLVAIVVTICIIAGAVAFCQARTKQQEIEAPAREVITNPPSR